MYDANRVESYEISIDLTEDEEGYAVTFTPDADWLLSEEREYPIVIDPTIAQITTTFTINTTTVSSINPNPSMYGWGSFRVGRSSAYQNMRSVLKFALPSTITESDMVIDARIEAEILFCSGPSGEKITINAHEITGNIVLSENLTWEDLEGNYSAKVLDSQTLDISSIQ